MEGYAALKWLFKNCSKYKIDPERICVTGESSGGYITTGIGMELAKRNESHLVKVMIPDLPMITSNTWLDLNEDQLLEPAAFSKQRHIQDTLVNMATDWD
jgi:acetyl esterase/lipase